MVEVEELKIIKQPKETKPVKDVSTKQEKEQKQTTTIDPKTIYKESLAQELPQIPKVTMKSKPDVKTIEEYHPEVLNQYAQLCKEMKAVDASDNPPGVCKGTPVKCCIKSGYRDPDYNKKIRGASSSPHMYALALDIHVGNDINEQLKWAKTASNFFTRVGIYPGSSHIHVDLMPLKGQFATSYWIGSGGKTLVTASDMNQLETQARKFT